MKIRDFSGREVQYSYDGNGDLGIDGRARRRDWAIRPRWQRGFVDGLTRRSRLRPRRGGLSVAHSLCTYQQYKPPHGYPVGAILNGLEHRPLPGDFGENTGPISWERS